MKTAINLIAALSLTCSAFSQIDTLTIKDEKRTLDLTENTKVRVAIADRVIKGELHLINDSVISIANDTIWLSQIESITTRRKYNRKVAGSILTGIGAAGDIGTATGAVAISRKSYGGFLGGLDALTDKIVLTLIGTGSVVFTTVGTILLCRNRTYKSVDYSYSIH